MEQRRIHESMDTDKFKNSKEGEGKVLPNSRILTKCRGRMGFLNHHHWATIIIIVVSSKKHQWVLNLVKVS